MGSRFSPCASALACFVIFTAPALATDYTWNSGNSGAFSNAANWTPVGGPPSSADNAIFSNPNTPSYTVTIAPGTAISAAQVSNDTVMFDLSAGTTTLGSSSLSALLMQTSADKQANLTLSNGTLSLPTGGVSLNNSNTLLSLNRPFLTVNVGATLSAASLSTPTAASGGVIDVLGQINAAAINLGSRSVLTVHPGATVSTIVPAIGGGFIYGDITGGYDSNSSINTQKSIGTGGPINGTLICGGNLKLGFTVAPPFTPGMSCEGVLQVGDSSHPSDMFVGEFGKARCTISTGSATLYHDLYLGHHPNSDGSMRMQGGTLSVASNVHIGADPAIIVLGGSTPAVGNMTVQAGAVATITGTIFVHPGGDILTDRNAAGDTARGSINAAAIQNSGTISGFGLLTAPITNNAVIRPTRDATLGHMDIHGDLFQSSLGILRINYSTDAPVDLLTVTGNANMAGVIDFNFTHTSPLHVGDSFLMFRCTGSMTGLPNVTSTSGYSFIAHIDPGIGYSAIVTAVPEPAAITLILAATSLLLTTRRR
jgi:hypothetical protein